MAPDARLRFWYVKYKEDHDGGSLLRVETEQAEAIRWNPCTTFNLARSRWRIEGLNDVKTPLRIIFGKRDGDTRGGWPAIIWRSGLGGRRAELP